MNVLAYLAPRMKEASSLAGAAAIILAAAHINANPDMINAGLGVVTALGGLLAILVSEKSAATTTTTPSK